MFRINTIPGANTILNSQENTNGSNGGGIITGNEVKKVKELSDFTLNCPENVKNFINGFFNGEKILKDFEYLTEDEQDLIIKILDNIIKDENSNINLDNIPSCENSYLTFFRGYTGNKFQECSNEIIERYIQVDNNLNRFIQNIAILGLKKIIKKIFNNDFNIDDKYDDQKGILDLISLLITLFENEYGKIEKYLDEIWNNKDNLNEVIVFWILKYSLEMKNISFVQSFLKLGKKIKPDYMAQVLIKSTENDLTQFPIILKQFDLYGWRNKEEMSFFTFLLDVLLDYNITKEFHNLTEDLYWYIDALLLDDDIKLGKENGKFYIERPERKHHILSDNKDRTLYKYLESKLKIK